MGCEASKLVKVSACLQPKDEIDVLNATDAFNRLPAYHSILLEDEIHHFSNHFDRFLAIMVDTLRAEMAQPHFYQNFIQKRATAGQQNCTQVAQSRQAAQGLPQHHRLLAMDDLNTVKSEPTRLVWQAPFTTEGSQGEHVPVVVKRMILEWLQSYSYFCGLAT